MKYRFLLILLPGLIFGCGTSASLDSAEKAYELQQYSTAAGMYEKLFDRQTTMKDKAEVAYKAGESYRKMGKWAEAEDWYNKAIALDYRDPDIYYNYGTVLKHQEKFDAALDAFERFKKENPADARAKQGITSLSLYNQWKNDKARFVVQKVEELNSPENDYAPSYFLDDNVIYFTSDRPGPVGGIIYQRTGLPFCDMYFSEWDARNNRWKKPEKVPGEINTDFNEGVTELYSRNGNFLLYYTQCNGARGNESNCKILVAERSGVEWKSPRPLSFCKDSSVNYGHPTLNADGNQMIFSANIPGGYGKHDLYLSKLDPKTNQWGTPQNLGPAINTPEEDMFPFLFKDKTLYFSSDGHSSIGGLDIYETVLSNGKWSAPRNLKPPINSNGDDLRMIFNNTGEKGHFSSNREGRDNIYTFYLKPKICAIKVEVVNLKSGKGIEDAKISIRSDKVGFDPRDVLSQKKGEYLFTDLIDCDYTYLLQASRENYFSSSEKKISTSGVEVSDTFLVKLFLDPIPPREIKLEGIYYGLDSFNLRQKSLPVLDSLARILKLNPSLVIELGSHTDCRASKAYNDTLSQKRAQSVVDYLVQNGINQKRLVAKGYGETRLVNDCACEDGKGKGLDCTEEEHQANRRTTFQIIRTNFKE